MQEIVINITSPEGIIKWLLMVVLTLIASIGITVHAQKSLLLDPAKEININRSRLIQLTRGLQSADISQQYEFVQIALIEMNQIYQSEIKKSRNTHPTIAKKQQKLLRWQYATQAFINQLDKYFLLLDSGVRVSLGVNRQQKVLLIIGGHPVIVNGPNPASHKLMEKNIVQQFCQVYDCIHYLDSPVLSSVLTKDIYNTGLDEEKGFNGIVNASGSWLLSSEYKAIYETDQGIDCEFKNSTERKKKAAACQTLADEASRLSKALQDARNAGNEIDREYLSIRPQANIDMVQIIINKQGYYIELSLPLLQKKPELFSAIRSWLQDSSLQDFSLQENGEITVENIRITEADRLLN
jgi:hypothetical protein